LCFANWFRFEVIDDHAIMQSGMVEQLLHLLRLVPESI
jgi:hypothetical protein